MNFPNSPRPARSPWGAIQHAEEIAPGIWHVDTAGHGGFRLSPERSRALPPSLRKIRPFAGTPWYEEDVDWAIPAYVWPDAFALGFGTNPARVREIAEETIRHYHANAWREFTEA